MEEIWRSIGGAIEGLWRSLGGGREVRRRSHGGAWEERGRSDWAVWEGEGMRRGEVREKGRGDGWNRPRGGGAVSHRGKNARQLFLGRNKGRAKNTFDTQGMKVAKRGLV